MMSCSPESLFLDHWNNDTESAFNRTESPYVDSPNAVILFELENLAINRHDWEIVRTRHVRIQIFTEEGKESANIRIPFYHDDNISLIKAQTILPNGERIKLKSSQIFEEGVKDGWRYKTFAIPGVEARCIIEYQYQLRSDRLALIEPKFFQGYLHNEYSKFSVTLPKGFNYTASVRNPISANTEPRKEEVFTPEGDYVYYIWAYKNIPAVRDEPYMYNRYDHLFSIYMQLLSYQDPHNKITFIKTWDDLASKIKKEYKSYLEPTRKFKGLLAKIEADSAEATPTPEQIYRFVQERVIRKSRNSLYAREANEVIDEMRASKVERNLLFLGLLIEAGYDADPLLISQRSNGKIGVGSPKLQDFNHVIIRLKQGAITTYHDVAFENTSFDLMPSDSYSGLGLPINMEKAELIEIPVSSTISKRQVLTNCILDETGTLTGSFSIKSSDYYAVSARSSYLKAETDDKFAYEEIVSHFPGIIVDSVSYDIPMDDFGKPVTTTVYFQLPDFTDFTGDVAYLPTTFYEAFKKNYLIQNERNHDLEFSYKFIIEETVNLTLPEGFEIVEIPQNDMVVGPGNVFRKMIVADGAHLQFSWKRQLSEIVQPALKYQRLKSFYTEAVAADQSRIVLKRKGL